MQNLKTTMLTTSDKIGNQTRFLIVKLSAILSLYSNKMRYYGGVIIVASIANFGCSALSPIEAPAIQKYTITTKTNPQKTTCQINNNSNNNQSIYIAPTSAIAPYNSIKMFYSYSPYSIDQYSQSFWATLPSSYVDQAIFNTMVTSCIFNQIYTDEFTQNVNYKLNTKLVLLQQTINNNHATVTLIINAQLVNHKNGKIRYKQFTTTSKINPSPTNMAIGASKDLQQFVTQLVAWINDEIGGYPPTQKEQPGD